MKVVNLERPLAVSPAQADTKREPRPLAFRLELQSMAALLTVLATVARLGGQVTYLLAAEPSATIGLIAPAHVAHRVHLALAQLIEVIEVSEATVPAA